MYDNDVHIDTTFSIYSNRTGVDFYTRPSNFTFYNCPMAVRYILALCIMVNGLYYIRCSACVECEVCGWCQLDFTCTGSNTSCTTGDWLTVSHLCILTNDAFNL